MDYNGDVFVNVKYPYTCVWAVFIKIKVNIITKNTVYKKIILMINCLWYRLL